MKQQLGSATVFQSAWGSASQFGAMAFPKNWASHYPKNNLEQAEMLWQGLPTLRGTGGKYAASLGHYAELDIPATRFLIDSPETIKSKVAVTESHYVDQPNDWSCGPAVFCTALRAVIGINVPFSKAVELTGANPEFGASNRRLAEAFGCFRKVLEVRVGVHAVSHLERKLPELSPAAKARQFLTISTLLESGYLVVLNLRHGADGVGHYAIVQALNRQAIKLTDPDLGLETVVPMKHFYWLSGWTNPVLHGWYAALRKRTNGAGEGPRWAA